MTDIGFVNGLMEGIENCRTEESIMPMSCKCILDRMVFKGAMTEKEREKIMRKIKDKPLVDLNEVGRTCKNVGTDITSEEAIKAIEYIRHVGNGEAPYKNDRQSLALDMAIEALQEHKTCKNVGTDYAECDQFVCSECGIELQDWHSVERCEDGEVIFHEYTFRYCPACGREVR